MRERYVVRGVVRYYGWQPISVVRRGTPHGDVIEGELDLSRNADVSRWEIPPHVALAKVAIPDRQSTPEKAPDAAAAVEAFVRRYGPLYRDDLDLRQGKSKGHFSERVGAIQRAQQLLRRAWQGEEGVVDANINAELADAFKISRFEVLHAHAAMGHAEALLETEDLWSYICFLFLLDFAENRTGICARPDCPTLYFIQEKRGQQYCSRDCAVLESVRRFRAKGKKTKEKKNR